MTEDVHIALVTATWGRKALTRTVLSYYNSLQIPGISISGMAAVSRDEDRIVANAAGWPTVRVPNQPLGAKFQAALGASRRLGAGVGRLGAYVIIGSDDLLSPSYLRLCADALRDGAEALTVRELYLYDLPRRALYVARCRRVGAGTMLSAGLLKRRPTVWDTDARRSLDGTMYSRVLQYADPWHQHFSLQHLGVAVCDVKTETNMWSIDELRARMDLRAVPDAEAWFAAHYGDGLYQSLNTINNPAEV